MMPSPAELQYFIEVAQSSNFSRASERLGISQPSLSLAIKRLENNVGVDLFDRHRHGVTLTRAGKQLLLQARQLLQNWENIQAQTLASVEQVQGCFTIGCNSTMAIHILSGFMADLLADHPHLEIQFEHGNSPKIIEQVIKLNIEIGIVTNPAKHPELIIKKLCHDEVALWISPEKRKIQDLESEEVVIICDPELLQSQYLLKLIRQKNSKIRRIIKTTSLEVVANLTASGCGVGLLPARVALSMFPDKLERIPNTPIHRDQLYLIYRNENRLVHGIQAIVNAVKNHFQSRLLVPGLSI